MKLDVKDKRILYELDLNSRASLNQIAKKVGLSKQVVDYRIKQLVKNKIIKQYYTVVNFSKLGYTQYKLYLKLQNVDVQKEKEIIDYWCNHHHTIWVTSCRGNWDLAVSVLAKNINEFGKLLDEFIQQYGLFVLEKVVVITQRSPVYTRAYLDMKKEKKEFRVDTQYQQNAEIDDIDKKILCILSTNARMSILDIMKKVNLSRDVVTYRIKKLMKQNIIAQYRVLINLDAIKYKLYKIILRLHSLTPQKERELIQFVASHTYGTQYLKLVGSWDAELEFEVENEEQLHEILLELRNKFSDIIRNYDTLLIHKEHKLSYFPF